MNNNNNDITQIQSLFNEVQSAINSNDLNSANVKISELKNTLTDLADPNGVDPSQLSYTVGTLNENTVDGQDLSIQQKSIILDTKLKQIEVINKRNENKKMFLLFLVIINILAVVVFIVLLVAKIGQ